MGEADRVLILVMRDVTPTEPETGEPVIGECVGYDGAPLSDLCHVVRGVHPVTKQLAWYVVGGGGVPPVGVPVRWSPMPKDQGLTVGDVLSVCEGADGSAAQHLHDADHQGPSKAERYRRIAEEYEEAAKKLRAAVQ